MRGKSLGKCVGDMQVQGSTTSVKELANEVVQQGSQLEEENPLVWLGKRWVAFLSS